MPLLDEEQKAAEDGEKEAIEMKEEGGADKEKEYGKAADGKKAKKEKKKKEPKEKKPPGPNCVETLSAGLDLANRDGKSINNDVCLDFDDVLAEPGSTHGLDPVSQISFAIFSKTKS